MTDDEWLACTDPQPMLEFLRGKASDRKLRLFAVACCRRIWNQLSKEESRHAVVIAEQFVEGLVTRRQLQEARQISQLSKDPCPWNGERACAWSATDRSAWNAAEGAARTSQVASSPAWDAACRRADRTQDPADREAVGAIFRRERDVARKNQAALLCDIFGPLPFHTISIEPAWQTSTVLSLAQTIYDNRRFEDMPVLADALEDAGCDNQDILSHCRQPGVHVKGCWVVDLIVGKE